MSISNTIFKFGWMYVVLAMVAGGIMTVLEVPDMTIIGILLIVLLLRYVVAEYMQANNLQTLSSDTYWSLFMGSFLIIMAFNMLMVGLLFTNSDVNSSALIMGILIGTALNAAAVAAGLFQAKRQILKNIKNSK